MEHYYRDYYVNGKFVTVYRVTRFFGGPEEGGWWYDWLTPVKVFRANGLRRFKKAIRKAEALIAQLSEWECSGDGEDLQIWMEDSPREFSTKRRPYYC